MARRTAAERPLTAPAAAGAEPAAAAEHAARATLAGLYGPGSAAWALNREAALLLGAGPRALLLQVAHPLVADGVEQHSDFRTDPWGRLAGTLRSYLRIVYGTRSVALAEIARLNRLHRRVYGPVGDADAAAVHGATYTARDPSLSLWVHATLVDSTLVAVDRWAGPLAPETRARFYAETIAVGRLFGVGEDVLPPDIDAFDAYVARQLGPDGPVHPTDTARDIAASILRPPLDGAIRGPLAARLGEGAAPARALLRTVPQPLVDALLVPAVGLLPATTRAEYGLPWGARERALDAWLVTAWRWWIPRLPTGLRWFPQALAADARMERSG